MNGIRKISVCVIAILATTSVLAGELVNESGLTVAQVIEKNISARGGLDAWQKIQTMVWVGHIESGKTSAQRMPFVLELKRPNKTRFEVKALSQSSVRMFDGKNGWKLLPAANHGKPEALPYRTDEVNFAREGQGIEGPLMDYQAKGLLVNLEGIDEVEGRKAYRLNIVFPSGSIHKLWIDAKTFLDIKDERSTRNPSGQSSTVSVYYRNYQTLDGLQVPFLIESGADNAKGTEQLVADKVLLNPSLPDELFTKPIEHGWHSKAMVEIEAHNPLRQTARPDRSMPGSGGG